MPYRRSWIFAATYKLPKFTFDDIGTCGKKVTGKYSTAVHTAKTGTGKYSSAVKLWQKILKMYPKKFLPGTEILVHHAITDDKACPLFIATVFTVENIV